MSETSLLLTVGMVWCAIGLGVSVVLARRGRDGFQWLMIGTVLGPLAVALAVDATQHDEPVEPVVAEPARVAGGTIDIFVGIDGSTESAAAVRGALDLLGAAARSVTLVRVIPFDAGPGVERDAVDEVRSAAAIFVAAAPGIEVLRGRPAPTLLRRAGKSEHPLVVVGARGEGRHLFGSTARQLASAKDVPVLVVGSGCDSRRSVSAGVTAHAAPSEPAPDVGAQADDTLRAAPGDRLVIRAHHQGGHDRDAEILEVHGADGAPPWQVRWSDDGHEGLLFPGPDAVVHHLTHPEPS